MRQLRQSNDSTVPAHYHPQRWERITVFAASGIVILVALALCFRNEPFRDANLVVIFRTVLSLSVASLGATVPGFLNVDLKGKGLAIRAGGALALFVVTYFFTPKTSPSEPPASSDSQPRLQFRTAAIENIEFVYNTKPWPFEVDPNGEDIMNPLTPQAFRDGLVTAFPLFTHFARIPMDSCYIDFTIENHGSGLAVIDQIAVEVDEALPLPATALANGYKPVLRPEQDEVQLSPDKALVPVFRKEQYKYAPGEVDKFRLKVSVPSESTDVVFRFRIQITYHGAGTVSYDLRSDRDYFLSAVPTDRAHDNAALHAAPSNENAELGSKVPPKKRASARISRYQEEAAGMRLENAIYVAAGKRRWTEFDDCRKSINSGNFRAAEDFITTRITRIDEFHENGVEFLDGGGTRLACADLRVALRLVNRNVEGAIEDMKWILAQRDGRELAAQIGALEQRRDRIDWFSEQMAQHEGDAKTLLLEIIDNVSVGPSGWNARRGDGTPTADGENAERADAEHASSKR